MLLCGRDQGVDFMLDVVERIDLPDVAYVILEAAGRSWYPGRFSDPPEENEPWLSWALDACGRAFMGLPPERTVLGGFSQGACIAAEYVARTPRPYRGVAVLTGALMGPDAATREPAPSLAGVRVFLGSSRHDEWIAPAWVQLTANFFARAGADVTLELFEDPEHHVSDHSIAAVRALLSA